MSPGGRPAMSTPQGQQPPHGAPQQPAEQPAWGQQQPPGGWGTQPDGQQRAGESTQAVARAGQQGWNPDETRVEPRIVSQPGDQQGDATQVWGPADQTQAAPPYASPEQHYSAPAQPGQQYPGQPQAQHTQPQQAHAGQSP